MDAKDILGLPKTSLPSGPQEKRPRPPRDSQRKPDGVSREVYALTGGWTPPLMPAVEASHLKRKQQQQQQQAENEKITWQWLPFTSSARTDNLQLYHWVRVVNGVPPTGDYSFAKFNKSVDILKYTDEEYEKFLNDPTWTKEETDQLFDLCDRFDLRFIVIADRFPHPRSVEELKSRYYAVSRALLIARAPSAGDVSGHPLVKEPYNVAQEVERKRALASLLSQTKQQEHKDAEILAEAKRIAESRLISKGVEGSEQVNATVDTESISKANAPAESVSPSNAPPAVGALGGALGPIAATDGTSTPASLRMLGVYLRTHVLEQMVQVANSSAGLRTIKRVDQTLQDLGVNIKPKVPTKAVCAEHLELRKEILTLLLLQKQLQSKEAEALANRDSHAETPGTPKEKGHGNSHHSLTKYEQRSHRGDQDRTFVPDAGSFGVERPGKRDHKRKYSDENLCRKIPGRFTDAPPSPPQSKRPRKLKASDG